MTYNQYSPIINMGILYGIFRRRNSLTVIHNRIYREQIYNYMASKQEIHILLDAHLGDYTLQEQYLLPDGGINLEKVLLRFQEFMKNEYSQRDQAFLERNGRLIFLAFLRPIINGKGYDFKEPQISEEKRLDIVIVFERQKSVIELKIWRGEEKHQKGLAQLHGYLNRTGLDRGFLIIFDFTQKGQQKWKQERIQVENKDIFAVWV